MNITKRKTILAALVASLTMLMALLLTGCGAANNTDDYTFLTDKGYLTLSVNPAIRIEYNTDGLVTGLEGRNDDGTAIAASYTDYIGKDCSTVLRDLVTDIYKAGYFIDETETGKRQIVLQIEPGSAMPDDDFLELLSHDVQMAMSDLALQSDVVDISATDYDVRYEKNGKPSPYITMAKAREIALTHAGVKAEDAVWDDREFDFDDGKPIFELEFSAGGVEYEYDIDARTGKIIKFETDRDDDRPVSAPNNPSAEYIGLEKAKSIALQHAGISAEGVRWEDREFDLDDGTPLYALEFSANGVEYDCDVHAETGKVVKFESERDDDWKPSTGSSTNQPTTSTDKPAASSYIGLEKAKSIALQRAGISAEGVRWEDREFDLDDGTPLYELEFSANGIEYECDVHAETGKVVKFESERDDDWKPSTGSSTSKPATSTDKPAASSYIGLEKAKSIALQRAGVAASSVRWEKAEFDYDDGRPVYELEFSANGVEYDCDVHAETGKVLDYDAERDDDRYDDDDDDDDDWDD